MYLCGEYTNDKHIDRQTDRQTDELRSCTFHGAEILWYPNVVPKFRGTQILWHIIPKFCSANISWYPNFRGTEISSWYSWYPNFRGTEMVSLAYAHIPCYPTVDDLWACYSAFRKSRPTLFLSVDSQHGWVWSRGGSCGSGFHAINAKRGKVHYNVSPFALYFTR